MIDYDSQLVTALKSILPTYHELLLVAGTKTPCISYQEQNNYTDVDGDTIGYSKISYQIKIWGTDIAIIQKYLLELDYESLKESSNYLSKYSSFKFINQSKKIEIRHPLNCHVIRDK